MTFATLVNNLVAIVNSYVIPLMYALAFLFFVWGVARYVFLQGEEGRQKAKNTMIYGLIGLVIIFGIWGILNVLLQTLLYG